MRRPSPPVPVRRPAPPAAAERRPRRGGFTLLEVLAAVVVVGLTFALLARWNIEGLRAESRAEWRLQASLVADRVLAEMEAAHLAGTPPQVGEQRRTVDGFEVLVDVQPLSLALADVPPEIAASHPETTTPPPGPTLLAAPGSGQVTPLRQVHVSVRWNDGIADNEVVRDTFAFDEASVASLLQPLAQQASGPESARPPESGADGGASPAGGELR